MVSRHRLSRMLSWVGGSRRRGVLRAIARELEVDTEDLQKHDFRESLSTLKRLSQTDARWGVALRTTADQIESGSLTPEELVRKLTSDDPEQGTP